MIRRVGINRFGGDRFFWDGVWEQGEPVGTYYYADSILDRNNVEKFYHFCRVCGHGFWNDTLIVAPRDPVCPRCVAQANQRAPR